MNRAEIIVLHHSLSDFRGDQLYIINQYHREQFGEKSELGFYVGYHKIVEKSGKIVITRNNWESGIHTIGWNDKSIGICLSGDFTKELPTKEQIETIRILLKEYNLPLRFHRDVQAARTCPGPINKSLFDPPPILPTPYVNELVKAENIKKQISVLNEIVNRLRLILALVLKK